VKELLFSAPEEAGGDNRYSQLADFEPILTAVSLPALATEVRRFAHGIGFAHYLYGARIALPTGEALQFILSGYPEAWMSHYQEAGYADIDPIVAHAYRSSTPLVWNEGIFDDGPRRAFWEEARSHGLTNGISVPVPCLYNEVALFSMACPESASDALAHQTRQVGTAFVLASYLHEAVRRLALAPELAISTPVRLTPRESECLHWWAAGNKVIEIADRLHLSERTVLFHLDSVKRKLGVRNKHQALARAALLKLVNP
jgi:DNA-binding CsgD family transcriptional regulator